MYLSIEIPIVNSVKRSILTLVFLLSLLTSFVHADSQLISASDRKVLRVKEDSLKQIATFMILDSAVEARYLAYKDFVPTLIRALKIKNSFYFPFDSVFGISKLYAPDSSFRIITWYLEQDPYNGAQKGIIQQRTKDGSLKLNWLFDNSDWTDNLNNTICRDTTWIGAVYYNIIKTQYQGKDFYTLFGIDRAGVRTTRKWIEVLTFDEKKQPVFGGPFFSFKEDTLVRPVQARFNIEYKKEASTFVNYAPDLKLILFDHLISEEDEPKFQLPWTYVPDGDYEGFKWQNGQWVHVDKVFTFKLQDGQAPVGEPLLDNKGNVDEEKLKQKSEANKAKKSGGN